MFSLEDRGRETDKPKEERGDYKDGDGVRWKWKDYVDDLDRRNKKCQRRKVDKLKQKRRTHSGELQSVETETDDALAFF